MKKTTWLMILWSLVSLFAIESLCSKVKASFGDAMLIGGLAGMLTFISYIIGRLQEKVKDN